MKRYNSLVEASGIKRDEVQRDDLTVLEKSVMPLKTSSPKHPIIISDDNPLA